MKSLPLLAAGKKNWYMIKQMKAQNIIEDPFLISGVELSSRLFVGTGKYGSISDMKRAVKSAKPSIVTVALKRFDLDHPDEDIFTAISEFKELVIMPNTSGAKNHEEAVRAANIGRELSGSDFVKVEIHPDSFHLMPDPMETFLACQKLVKEKFIVMPYIQSDPILAKRLEEIGCAAVMPLGSVIGSGQGLVAKEFIKIIIARSTVPVIVDAGIRSPSDAALALEIGASAVLVNTALALSDDPSGMGKAFSLAVHSGRIAYKSGIMDKSNSARSSSLTEFLE